MVKTQQFCANFNWILHTFRFPNLLTLTTKPHFVNTQSNQNLTSWSYSILTKPNQIRHNPSRANNTIYRIQIVISILSVIQILPIISVAWKANSYPSKNLVVHSAAIQRAHLPCKFINFSAFTSLHLLLNPILI